MVSSILTIAQLPARATLRALKQAGSPNAINALSSAIAQASIRQAGEDETINVQGAEVNIIFDQERILTTAGFSTAVAIGSVYWIGNRLKMQARYARMISALERLQLAISKNQPTAQILTEIDQIANPLLDPDTLQLIDEYEAVQDLYESLFAKPAQNGSMFNASTFTDEIAKELKTELISARKVAQTQADEALTAMIQKAKPIAKGATSRLVGAVLWVDTVWWVATSILDLGLNYLGIDEEDQRIPILADIPFIGALFDLSDSTGSSFVDLVLTPIIDGIIGLIGAEDQVEALSDALWAIITSAILNPTLTPFIIALLDFYIEEISIDFNVPAGFEISAFSSDLQLDLFPIRPEPIQILILWLYAITAKIFVKAWIVPAFASLRARAQI